ncbi:hypothetical protein [Fodinibius halophilus]|uniref:DUF2938 domain-containing protein n=1 Tax=Fodinibius halophilus TaxID=1736908 RepID=A0A6M1T4V1_9BACT|nr:hypothetical protein [Fodinibius halophilus]NGP89099.1 hypothetical protein [Fodinibius halophilus]
MKWIKSAFSGLAGSFVMFIIMMVGIHATGFAPFNTPPSAAFLHQLGLNIGPLPLIVHFGYGAFWSVVLYYFFKESVSIKEGIYLALALWGVMMLILSPIIGWGFFGFGGADELAADAPLYLESGPKYLIMTLILHLIYGAIIGWGNAQIGTSE